MIFSAEVHYSAPVSKQVFVANTSPAPMPTYAPVLQSEMSALEDFYYSTGGPNWLDSQGWNFTGVHNPCAEDWYYSFLICNNMLLLSSYILMHIYIHIMFTAIKLLRSLHHSFIFSILVHSNFKKADNSSSLFFIISFSNYNE